MSEETPTSATTPEAAPGAAPTPSGAPEQPSEPGAASEAAETKPKATAKELAAASRAQWRARQQRKEAQRQAKEAQAAREASDAQVKELRGLVERLTAERDAVTKDPLAHAPDPEKAIRSYVDKNTPEATIGRLEQTVAALQKQIADEREAQKREKEEAATREEQRNVGGAIQAFAQSVVSEGPKYPYLNAEYEVHEIAAQAADIHARLKKIGKAATFPQIAAHLDSLAKKRYEAKEEKRKSLLPAKAGEPASPAGVQDGAGKPGSGRRDESARPAPGTAKKPKGRILTRAEQEAHDMAILNAAAEKDRLSRLKEAKH